MGAEELSARRGDPSYVWRAGQERRLELVRRYAPLEGKQVLDAGCGLGLYSLAFGRFTPRVFGVEIEPARAGQARQSAVDVAVSPAERLPFADGTFDIVFSHEVLEHVADDRLAVGEMVRVARPGGRVVIFCPNRWWPFETHGHFWRGRYHFGNTPLINYLPDPLRNKLAPHVRAYTGHKLKALLAGLPVHLVVHRRVFPGFDKLALRSALSARLARGLSYTLENTPLQVAGLSHLLVVEKKRELN
ncbi:MAG: class I SAM-dependent methyltransferase [Thermoflexales bacterium]|nr:class I SAM-dependent methyltransferase [Thermoflexales bacterium]